MGQRFVGPYLDPNWLPYLSADDPSREGIVVSRLYKDSHVRQDINSFACWVIFLHFCCLLNFFKINFLFFLNSFRNTIRVSNSLDPGLGPTLCCKDYQQTTTVGKELLPQDSTKIVMLDKTLTPCICMMGNFSIYLSSANFFQNKLSPKILSRNTIRVSNSLDPDWARHYDGRRSGSKLFAKNISRRHRYS